MNSLTKVLLEDLLDADNKKVTAIYGGGFKPPTKGHFDVVAKASEQNPEIDDILIYVGDGERDGISQGESIQIWELYKKYLPIKTIIEPVNAPIGSILRYAKDHPKEKILWIIGARENNPEDFADIASRTRTLEKYPNLQLRVIQTSGGVSGTAARNAVKDNNKEQFFHLIPDIPEKEQVWDIISPVVKEEKITEVGEANLSPYKWEEVNKNSWVTFIEFTTESETKYKVNLTNVEIVDPEGGNMNLKAIDIEFFAKPKGAEDSSSKIVVNKGEIYRVMSTLTSIIKHYIKEIEAQAIIYSPSKKSDEEDFGTQRDNLYKAFINKAIPGIKFKNSKNNIIAILPNTVNEIVTDTEVICDKCDWKWKIVDGGNDLYICHKCGHDNNPDLQESKNIFKTILKDGETIYLELKYSMQERDYTSLSVIAYDSNNNKIGAAYFNSDETDKKMVISAADTSIKDTWRRKGVASSVYDLIKKQGYKIVPSKSQSDDGLKFTDKYFKQNEINPSTKLKSNIINEGRYDSISRQLASYTLKGWKDDFEHNEPTGRVEFTVGPDGDLEYEDLKFSYKGVAIFAGIQTYSYNGSARLTSGEIKITYSIPKSMLPQGWEKIYMDLISVIRHEIEHLTQGGVNVKPGKEILDLPLRRLVIKYPDTLRYILLPSEKDANVQGLYLKAKKSRRPYAEVVDEYIRDVLKITNKNDVDILKGMYDKRAKELNLPAILENDPFGLNKLSRQFIKEALIETWNPKESFVSLSKYMIDNGMNIKPLPKIKIISNDEENASNLLGKTAYYNPNDKSITLYTKDRHPKDICRSFTHEMVHHEQNLEGRLNNINTTNTNEDGALPEIEKEAYEKGNMMLRNWEDSIKNV
jgi:hypothetical protein